MELIPLILLVIGLILVKFSFLFSVTLLGYIEKKLWLKRIGAWSLFVSSLLCGFTIFIGFVIYLIWSMFYY